MTGDSTKHTSAKKGQDLFGRRIHMPPGVALRDWFAGQAMQALASDMAGVVATADEHGVNPTVLMAKLAYGMADAMLAARDTDGGAGGDHA